MLCSSEVIAFRNKVLLIKCVNYSIKCINFSISTIVKHFLYIICLMLPNGYSQWIPTYMRMTILYILL